ncbi:MAG: hypothetical protein JXR34_07225 [Bacteroidales bacterium]|nr:hypothetical protein [Bacteroidales bacterium]
MKIAAQAIGMLLFLVFSQSAAFSQSSDSIVKINSDTSYTEIHSAKKAGWMSAALPGLGQVYNKKYWKVPIVYAALGTTTYFIIDNNKKYQNYRQAYANRLDSDTLNDTEFMAYKTEDLRELKNYYWRYRDLNAFLFVGIWMLNILDAVVDAHLYTFDIGNNLSMRIQPSMHNTSMNQHKPVYGLSFQLRF